ncbi:MAG: photosystem II oxygen evolving complex protein PsbU [Pseudanabaena sp. CRU_2_10]|nr:photosystem II oxygen evolving complex protein PsbU [Pseudanabaena sp. CRU_2_10]
MKALARLLFATAAIAVIFVAGFLGINNFDYALAADLPDTSYIKADSSKIDLNNANIYQFRQVPGMYPTLGRIIIENAPYNSLDEVLAIKGLTADQQDKIRSNADRFALFKPDNSMQRERINNATYRL